MVLAKVGRRGQLTLPSTVRQALGVKEGDSIAFAIGEVVTLVPVKKTLLDLRGSVPVSQEQDFEAVRHAAAAARALARAHDDV